MTQRELEVLEAEECFALLGRTRIGRLVYLDDLGPVAVPVNFALSGREVLFPVGGGAKQAAMTQPTLAFEVDHVDDDDQAGWSVIVRGAGQQIPLELVPEVLHRMDGRFPRPWAVGVHNVWLKITPTLVTGRRLGEQRTPPAV